MGMLDSDPGSPAEETPTPESPDPNTPAPAEDVPLAAEAPKEHVPLGRRARAKAERDAVEAELRTIRETTTKQTEELRRELAARDAQIAQLRGGFEALQPLITQARPQQQQQEEDPASIRRQARAHLDRGEFDAYEELSSRASRLETIRDLEARGVFKQQAQQVPNIDPRLQVIMNMHPTVAMHPQGSAIARAKDLELAALTGMPDGPERWKKAFELAESTLRGMSPGTQGYSQQAAGALAGIPTGRTGGGAAAQRGPGVELSEVEKQWARAADMTLEEYAQIVAKSHPERIVR